MLCKRILQIILLHSVISNLMHIDQHYNRTTCLEKIIQNNFMVNEQLIFITNYFNLSLENIPNSKKYYLHRPNVVEESNIILQGNNWLSENLFLKFGYKKNILVITEGNITTNIKSIFLNLWMERKIKLGNCNCIKIFKIHTIILTKIRWHISL